MSGRRITRTCLKKIRYRTKHEADEAMERFRVMGYPVSDQETYFCRFCQGCHIGRKRLKVYR